MAINAAWARWIAASVVKHFNDGLNTKYGDIFVEGQERTSDRPEPQIELRIDGPYYNEISKNVYYVDIEVNLVYSITMHGNMYRNRTVAGDIASFCVDIPVFKLGNEEGDDGTHVTCLRVRNDLPGRQKVVTNEFGQIEPATRILQGSVEVHYRTQL